MLATQNTSREISINKIETRISTNFFQVRSTTQGEYMTQLAPERTLYSPALSKKEEATYVFILRGGSEYGRDRVIGGGWRDRGSYPEHDVSDDVVRQSVRDCMDKYDTKSGYVFVEAYTDGQVNNERSAYLNEVGQSEAFKYARLDLATMTSLVELGYSTKQ
jgi:hypothetical protein